MTPKQKKTVTAVGAVFAASIAIVVWIFVSPFNPETRAWKNMSKYIKNGYRKGDLVRIDQTWRAKKVKYFSGLDVIAAPSNWKPKGKSYRRMWWIEKKKGERKGPGRLLAARKFNAYRVTLLEMSPPAWILLYGIEKAQVMTEKGGKKTPCRYDRGRARWICGNQGWEHVSRTTLPIGGLPRQCIWAHPIPGTTTIVSFNAKRTGRTIVIGSAFADRASNDRKPGWEMDIAVEVNGIKIGQYKRTRRKGWQRRPFNLPPRLGKQVRITVKLSAKQTGAAHFCFDAEI